MFIKGHINFLSSFHSNTILTFSQKSRKSTFYQSSSSNFCLDTKYQFVLLLPFFSAYQRNCHISHQHQTEQKKFSSRNLESVKQTKQA